MKPFNLAESRIAERSFCRRQLNSHLRAIAIIIGLALCVAVGAQACKQSIRNRATQVKSQLAEIQSKCVDIKCETAEVDKRISQRGWQRQLANGSKRRLSMVDSVFGCLPSDVWLSRMESSSKSAGVSIDGKAATVESMTRFINELRVSAGFKEVRLTGTKMTGTNDSPCVSFTLEAQLNANPARKSTDSNQVPDLK